MKTYINMNGRSSIVVSVDTREKLRAVKIKTNAKSLDETIRKLIKYWRTQ